jgi:predicted nuclease with TOPRIM domain
MHNHPAASGILQGQGLKKMERLHMPTLECLDERTRRILDAVEDMKSDFTARFDSVDSAFSLRLSKLEADIRETKKDVIEIKLASSKQEGQKGVVIFVGGIILALLGAIGNMVLLWLLGPNGLLHKPPIQ